MFKKENINWKFKKHQLIIDNISIDNLKNLTLIYSFAYNKDFLHPFLLNNHNQNNPAK